MQLGSAWWVYDPVSQQSYRDAAMEAFSIIECVKNGTRDRAMTPDYAGNIGCGNTGACGWAASSLRLCLAS
jgi:hypothetical protein